MRCGVKDDLRTEPGKDAVDVVGKADVGNHRHNFGVCVAQLGQHAAQLAFAFKDRVLAMAQQHELGRSAQQNLAR